MCGDTANSISRFFSESFAWLMTASLTPPLRLAIAGDTFFAANLVLMVALAMRVTPDQLRNWASIDDEGIIIIVIITLVVISFSLISIFSVLNQSHRPNAVLLILQLPARHSAGLCFIRSRLSVTPTCITLKRSPRVPPEVRLVDLNFRTPKNRRLGIFSIIPLFLA